MNIFDSSNQKIFDFVQEPANASLMRGTGSYSTPFRGELFGLSESEAVAQELQTRKLDVLWFGTNPNVPQSIAQIVDPTSQASDFPDFVRQKESGLFSSWRWDQQGHRSLDWNPIQVPTANWAVYRDIFANVAEIDAVTMANFIPWGSQDIEAFLNLLGAVNPGLLKRAVSFANEIARDIVRATEPRLVVVPFSLGRAPQLNRVHPIAVAMEQAAGLKHHKTEMGPGVVFNYSTGVCALGVPVVYLRHPVSLRLAGGFKQQLIKQVSTTLAEFI